MDFLKLLYLSNEARQTTSMRERERERERDKMKNACTQSKLPLSIAFCKSTSKNFFSLFLLFLISFVCGHFQHMK